MRCQTKVPKQGPQETGNVPNPVCSFKKRIFVSLWNPVPYFFFGTFCPPFLKENSRYGNGTNENWRVWNAKCGGCQMWSVEWSLKCGVSCVERAMWIVECEVWTVECEVWSVLWQVWSVSVLCGLESVHCEGWSVRCGTWSVEWRACSGAESGVWSVECEVWSASY